jgi:hypothetical protein
MTMRHTKMTPEKKRKRSELPSDSELSRALIVVRLGKDHAM